MDVVLGEEINWLTNNFKISWENRELYIMIPEKCFFRLHYLLDIRVFPIKEKYKVSMCFKEVKNFANDHYFQPRYNNLLPLLIKFQN